MKNTKIRVLVIDDDEDDLFLTVDFLKAIDTFQITIDSEINYKKARERILLNEHDVYIIDYLLGPHTGVELIKDCVSRGVSKPYILLTGKGDRQIDIEATKAGAYDYLIKPEISTELLERSLRYSYHRYKAHKETLENEKRFRDIFEKSTDSIFILDKDFNLTKFNPVFNQAMGYNTDEITGIGISSFFADKNAADSFLSRMQSDKVLSNYEVVLKTKNNEPRTFIASCTALEGSDNDCYQCILFDYTTIKKSVADAILKERTDANQQLVRTLAHEIRNPLTNINLSVTQLEEEVAEDLKIFTDMIRRNSDRINGLLTELINVSSPGKLNLAPISVQELIADTLVAADDRFKLKEIELIKALQGNDLVEADKEKMKIALLNIVINGIEAIDKKQGKMQVETYRINNLACIKISDTGIGIQPQDIDRLFQPYFTGKKNGMGLGLASTQSIVKAHRGDISVSSIPGEGTTFIVSLPTVA